MKTPARLAPSGVRLTGERVNMAKRNAQDWPEREIDRLQLRIETQQIWRVGLLARVQQADIAITEAQSHIGYLKDIIVSRAEKLE
jgi:hypothetical protein